MERNPNSLQPMNFVNANQNNSGYQQPHFSNSPSMVSHPLSLEPHRLTGFLPSNISSLLPNAIIGNSTPNPNYPAFNLYSYSNPNIYPSHFNQTNQQQINNQMNQNLAQSSPNFQHPMQQIQPKTTNNSPSIPNISNNNGNTTNNNKPNTTTKRTRSKSTTENNKKTNNNNNSNKSPKRNKSPKIDDFIENDMNDSSNDDSNNNENLNDDDDDEYRDVSTSSRNLRPRRTTRQKAKQENIVNAPETPPTRTLRSSKKKSYEATIDEEINQGVPIPVVPSDNDLNNGNGVKCPICNLILNGDTIDINTHIDLCLTAPHQRKSKRNAKKVTTFQENNYQLEEQEQDQEDDIETYTWDGQTRVRTTSLLSNMNQVIDGDRLKKIDKEEDGELDVEEDNDKYGASQYSDHHLIRMIDNRENKTLRARVLSNQSNETLPTNVPINSNEPGNNGNAEQQTAEQTTEQNSDNALPEYNEETTSSSCLVAPYSGSNENSALLVLIDSLKSQIKEQDKLLSNAYKCKVCLDNYQTPLVSINCWHVLCEKCWLSALGAKKLCPQCKAITSPTDLRRIFM